MYRHWSALHELRRNDAKRCVMNRKLIRTERGSDAGMAMVVTYDPLAVDGYGVGIEVVGRIGHIPVPVEKDEDEAIQ